MRDISQKNSRYIVHDFCLGNPVLIDREEKTLRLYRINIYGQISNLANPSYYDVTPKRVNGLIKRTNNGNYRLSTSKVIDSFIFEYLMPPEQQSKCGREPMPIQNDTLIAASDSYAEAITKMCEWAYENWYCYGLADKEASRSRNLEYCQIYLESISAAPPPALTRHDHASETIPKDKGEPDRDAR